MCAQQGSSWRELFHMGQPCDFCLTSCSVLCGVHTPTHTASCFWGCRGANGVGSCSSSSIVGFTVEQYRYIKQLKQAMVALLKVSSVNSIASGPTVSIQQQCRFVACCMLWFACGIHPLLGGVRSLSVRRG